MATANLMHLYALVPSSGMCWQALLSPGLPDIIPTLSLPGSFREAPPEKVFQTHSPWGTQQRPHLPNTRLLASAPGGVLLHGGWRAQGPKAWLRRLMASWGGVLGWVWPGTPQVGQLHGGESECLVFQEQPRQTAGRAWGVGSERLQRR